MRVLGLVAALLLFGAVGSFAARAAASDAPAALVADARKLAVANQMIEAWHDKDWRAVANLFSEHGSLRSMMTPPVDGRAAIYDRVSALGAGISSITLDVEHMGLIDGRVFIERTDRFIYKGHSGAVPVVGVLSFDGDKISEWREYYDRAQLMREMGVAPPEPQPAAR